jgi:hypothetical protein
MCSGLAQLFAASVAKRCHDSAAFQTIQRQKFGMAFALTRSGRFNAEARQQSLFVNNETEECDA